MTDSLQKMFIVNGLSVKDAGELSNFFTEEFYKKGAYLLHPGDVAKKIFFVTSGSVLLGQMTDKKPVIRHMVSANEFVTSIAGFEKQTITDEFLKANTDCKTLTITKGNFDICILRFPQVKYFYEKAVLNLLLQCQQRITNLTTKDAKAHYEELLHTHPEMIQNMNQYELASYLGIEPQSLSRLRGKK